MITKKVTYMNSKTGKVTALSLFILGTMYILVTIRGLMTLKSRTEPISNPWFSMMEILIIIMAPLMVLLMAVIYQNSAEKHKVLTLAALIFMGITAGITCSLHYVILTVSNSIEDAAGSDIFPYIISFNWPSIAYALDILAWDFFFPLSMICAAPSFYGSKLKLFIKNLMIMSSILSFIGLLGPISHQMLIRNIGIIGYGPVFIVVCFLLYKYFSIDKAVI